MEKEPAMAAGKGQDEATGASTADDAMNAALEAEQKAQEAVDECQEEADRLVEQARQQARRIADRTDDRISRLHSHCGESTENQVQELLAKAEDMGQRQPPDAQKMEVLEAAVRRLAATLTRSGGEEA